MRKIIWNIEYDLEVRSDEWWNPREDSNIWTLITQTRNYDLSDEEFQSYWNNFTEDFAHHINNEYNIIDEFESNYEMSHNELETIYKWIDENIIYQKVYMYDHSWITINTTWFSCRWDSWQIGYIYAHKENITKELIVEEWEDWEKKLREVLDNEIKAYNKYINWEYYQVTLESREIKEIDWKIFKSEWEHIESMWWLDKASDILDYISKEDCPFTAEEIDDCEITY